jgi:ABC-type sugar transport system ATPase subunit
MNLFPPGTLEAGDAIVGVRPEHLLLADGGVVPAKVTLVEALGHEQHVSCALSDGTIVVARVPSHVVVPSEGEDVTLGSMEQRRHRFDPVTGVRIGP